MTSLVAKRCCDASEVPSSDDERQQLLAEMNRLYSPSRWTKRMSPDIVVDNHIAVTTSVSNRAKSRLSKKLDVRFGSTERQSYDVLYDASTPAAGKPVVVYIHGGYWQALSKDISSYAAEVIVEAGAVFVAVDYDLCPDVSVTEIVGQIQLAVQHIEQMAVRHQFSGIYLIGHSAGAQLAAMTLASKCCLSLIKGAVLISGIYDLRPLLNTSENDVLKLTEQEAWTVSPINHENVAAVGRLRREAEVLVAVAENDSPPFRQQSRQYHQLLSKCNLSSVSFVEVPDVDHFDIVENLQDSKFTLTRTIVDLIARTSKTQTSGIETDSFIN